MEVRKEKNYLDFLCDFKITHMQWLVSRMFGVNLQALLSYTYVLYLAFLSSLSVLKEH